jgi:WD40 repeat protein
MENGEPVISLGNAVYVVVAFSPDSHYIAESPHRQDSHDSYIRVVELASGKQVSTFGKHAAFAIAMSPDSVTLASGHWNAVTLWNMLTGKRMAILRGFGRYVVGLSFSRDGKLLAAGTDAGGLQVWDVRSLSRVESIEIGGGEVSEPEFSPDGRLVAVGVYGTGTV